MQAKRAAREAGRGFEAGHVAARLVEFVASGGDMMALDPMGKRGLSQTVRMARLLQLKAGIHGSGKKRVVMVACTDRTQEPTSAILKELAQLAGVEIERQRKGALFGGPVGSAGMAVEQASQAVEHTTSEQHGGALARPVIFVASHTIHQTEATDTQVLLPVTMADKQQGEAACASRVQMQEPTPPDHCVGTLLPGHAAVLLPADAPGSTAFEPTHMPGTDCVSDASAHVGADSTVQQDVGNMPVQGSDTIQEQARQASAAEGKFSSLTDSKDNSTTDDKSTHAGLGYACTR